MTFTCSANLEFASKKINGICLASKPSMQLTNSAPSFADYPLMTGRLSKWNSLQIEQLEFDYWTVEQIVSIFSAVTDLKLLVNSSHQIAFLAVLLTHCQWRGQLTELLFFIFDETAITDQFSCFLTAINGLSSLQALAIKIPHAVEEILGLNNLKALAWLKVVSVKIDSWFVPLFMRSLERYAADNAHLQVHLFSNGNSLLNLDEPLRGRVVRYVNSGVEDHANSIPFLCRHFSSLTSLTLFTQKPAEEMETLFQAVAQLPNLVHLELVAFFPESPSVEEERLPFRPLTQLPSVRALDLFLLINSHAQVEWLNLGWTLPNCQAIHLRLFSCKACRVYFTFEFCSDDAQNFGLVPVHTKALECYKAALHKLHRGVHPKKIILAAEELPLEELPLKEE